MPTYRRSWGWMDGMLRIRGNLSLVLPDIFMDYYTCLNPGTGCYSVNRALNLLFVCVPCSPLAFER